MAHQPMHVNDWIELDSEYKWYLDEKARVIEEQGTGLGTPSVSHTTLIYV